MIRNRLDADTHRPIVVTFIVFGAVLAGSVAFAGAASAEYGSPATEDASFDDGAALAEADPIWLGQTVVVETYGSDAQIHEGFDDDGEVVATVFAGDHEAAPDGVVFETADLETGRAYTIVPQNESAPGAAEATFRFEREDLDAAFETDVVTREAESVALTFESDRDAQNVEVTADGLSAGDLADVFSSHAATDDEEGSLTLGSVGGDDTLALDPSDVDPGTYAFEFAVTDTNATATATIEVVDEDPERAFADAPVAGERGSIVEVPIELEYVDEGAVRLGDRETVGFESIVEFDVEGDRDEITLLLNTHVAGSEPQAQYDEDGWGVVEGDVEIDAETVYPDDPFETPIEAGDYPLVLGDRRAGEGIGTVEDRSSLSIDRRTPPGTFSVYTAPAEDEVVGLESLQAATITDADEGRIARHDHLLVRVDDFGAGGAVDLVSRLAEGIGERGESDGTDVSPLIASEGIYLEVVELEPGPNEEATVWNSSDDLAVRAANVEHYRGDLVGAIEYDDLDLSPFESYEVRFKVTPESSYIDDPDLELEQTAEFEFVERDLEWSEGAETLGTTAGASPRAWTNVAPGTTIETSLRTHDGFDTAAATVESRDDGYRYVEPTYDLGDQSPGAEYELTATDAVYTDLEATLVGDVVEAAPAEGDEPTEDGGSDGSDDGTGGGDGADETDNDTGGTDADENGTASDAIDDAVESGEDGSGDDATSGFGPAVAVGSLLAATIAVLRRRPDR
ncbi:hypothetical protein ACFO5R_16480 [Halosolutus amylolyticus]|uniref:DUF7827 domain-containing protein n=1 Tax=Halosolutus amylolyticus TaxID=2932267 RepID=A0ABD5PSL9_9EURY|nr:hypothetical protein [Halosolutus amylolyticus]